MTSARETTLPNDAFERLAGELERPGKRIEALADAAQYKKVADHSHEGK